MAEFLAMGGYAPYVWASYAVFFVVLALDALAPRAQRKRVLAELRGRLKRRQSRTEARR
ncbi:MAG: heme exporter protein CcmD [Rhodanobacteraceae bacterium]|jgi:heme exporter protein D|nr:heme exporter protein CcmD [Rhodanobacteraceae bacterium]